MFNQPKSFFKFLYLLVIIIVCGYILFIIGYQTGRAPILADPECQQIGYEKAKQEILEANIVPEEKTANFIRGVIEKINRNSFELTAQETTINPLLKGDTPGNRKVLVNDETQILKRVGKDKARYKAEMAAYNQAKEDYLNKKTDTMPTRPDLEEYIEISFDDLEVGNKLIIESEEDIKFAEEFTAKTIKVEPRI